MGVLKSILALLQSGNISCSLAGARYSEPYVMLFPSNYVYLVTIYLQSLLRQGDGRLVVHVSVLCLCRTRRVCFRKLADKKGNKNDVQKASIEW